jgi:pantothenate kinase type III
MDTKAKIKVIKRNSQPEFKISKSSSVVKTKTAQQSARDVVSTVSSWVNDFQQKRREETKEAFNLLFEAQNPNNCANC